MAKQKVTKLDVNVLYVEDEEDIRTAVMEALQRRVKVLYTAENGQEGLDMFKDNDIDIVITDIKMPIMNGLEMSEKIREIRNDVPIIVTTAYEESDFFHKSIEIGINGYVVKPVNMKKLHELLIDTARKIELEKRVKEQVQCIESLINLRDDIVIMIESKYMNVVNKAFLDFFGFKNLEEFNDKYENIVDFIEDKKEYIYKPKDNGNNWIEFLLSHGKKEGIKSITGLIDDDSDSEFLVTFEKLPNSNKYIVIMRKIDEKQ